MRGGFTYSNRSKTVSLAKQRIKTIKTKKASGKWKKKRNTMKYRKKSKNKRLFFKY